MLGLSYITWMASAVALTIASTSAFAELRAPKVGLRMVWDCEGPYSKHYDLTVRSIEDNTVRYEGKLDGQDFFSEKHADLTGTSLWIRLFGDRAQWFDAEDFDGYRMLTPGSLFKGAVPARQGEDKWVWGYQVSVGMPQTVNHKLLGKVQLVPVTEQRKIYHGTYWSKMTTYLLPELGVSVSWTYEDASGIERCDLVALEG